MNFKNLSENLIIVIISAFVGGFIGYKASTSANKQSIELLTPTITEAIKKETTSIKNEITHDIKVDIDKIKKSDSININIVQKPDTKQDPKNTVIKPTKTGVCPTNTICFPIENLTRRQKKRLGIL